MKAICPECNSQFTHRWGDVGKDVNCPSCGASLHLAVEGQDEDFCVVEVIANNDFDDVTVE